MLCPSCSNIPCKPSRPRWYELPLLPVMRAWTCPHCFRRYLRPIVWVGPTRCPRCGSCNAPRSKLRWYDWPLLLLLMLRPRRCRDCRRRYRRPIVWF